jgi:lipopolysaccharide/colanic/teichoic acid biosynthesis glycosyltransferase
MAAHRGVLPVIMLGVGAAFDFLSGQKPQAYPWMQRLGLEWAFRLATEPRRLWFRYFYQNPRFVALIAWQLFRAAWLAPPQSARTGPANLTGATQSDTAAGAIRLELLESSLSQKRVQLCLKRVFDQCGAAVALLTLAPALLLIAVLVRSSSRGPVLFRQARVGYRGKEFVMYKFRSMRVEGDPALAALQHVAAQQGVLVKVEHDPRVTGVGRVLRATSLDELPQLFNILKGQMSFVGPRPLIAFMLQPCPEFARARSLVRPGITGLWQVRERHNNTSAFSMKAHDLEYVQQFSLRLDMAILFKTARVVVSRQGAC